MLRETMKRVNLFLIFAMTFSLHGCAMNTGTGILTGGAIGTLTAAIAGGGKSAFIGTAAGVITGGLIGAALDEQDRQIVQRTSPRTVDRMDRNDPLTLNDVIKLSQSGISDDAIIRYLNETCTSYHLTETQARRLREGGVSQRVIRAMGDVSE